MTGETDIGKPGKLMITMALNGFMHLNKIMEILKRANTRSQAEPVRCVTVYTQPADAQTLERGVSATWASEIVTGASNHDSHF